MRVTNGMIRNNTLNSLYTNMGRLDTLYTQMTTLKKIQRPSDNPIVAGRALKLRINVLEAEQYKSNTDEAISWMSITEKALDNITGIIKDIRYKCVHASTDTLETEDREKIKADIDQLWEQLQQESNVTYAGRHVFSGYKTNEPVMLVKETSLTEETSVINEMTLLKGTVIPVGGMRLSDGTLIPAGTLLTDIQLPITTIPSTTMLAVDKVLAEPITLPVGTVITAGDVKLPDGTTLPATGSLAQELTIPAGTTLKAGFTLPTEIKAGTILPVGTSLPKGTINPKVLGKIEGQNLQYEVGVGSTITVNTLGVDKLMSQIFSDIKQIKDALDTHEDPDPANHANLHEIFEKMLGVFDKRLSTASEMTADLGSRTNRLEYTASRLTDDKANFTELLSNTEDVDLEEIYTEFNAQYAVYQSALQATSKVIMNTLADFLR